MVIGGLGQMVAASWQKAVIGGSETDAAATADSYQTLMSLAERGALNR